MIYVCWTQPTSKIHPCPVMLAHDQNQKLRCWMHLTLRCFRFWSCAHWVHLDGAQHTGKSSLGGMPFLSPTGVGSLCFGTAKNRLGSIVSCVVLQCCTQCKTMKPMSHTLGRFTHLSLARACEFPQLRICAYGVIGQYFVGLGIRSASKQLSVICAHNDSRHQKSSKPF